MAYPKKTDDNKNNDQDKKSKENLFQIMDGIIDQLNITKKIFIIMIITIMIIPPLSFAVTFTIFGPPFPFWHSGRLLPEKFDPQQQFGHYFGIARFLPFLISLVWLGIGTRQWFVLSKWSRRYEHYKELQRKIDQKLDYDEVYDSGDKGREN